MDDDMISLGLNCGERECVECIHVDLCRFVHVKKDEPCAFRKTAVDPVRHGRWICHPDPDKVALVCSVCGQVMPFVPEYLPEEPPYCNCGARMDGEV